MPVSKTRKSRNRKKTPKTATPMANLEISRKDKGQNGKGAQLERHQSFYQGIVPSPEMMEKYKEVDPGLPMLLVGLTKDEAIHRRDIEKKLVRQNITKHVLGQILAFLSVLAVCLLSYFYMAQGNPVEGKWIAVSIIVSLACAFLGRKVFASSENEKSK